MAQPVQPKQSSPGCRHFKATWEYIFLLLLMPLIFMGLFSGCSGKSTGGEPPEFKVINTKLAKGIDASGSHGIPFGTGSLFTTDDERVVSHIEYQNLVKAHDFRWEWVDPQGNVYMDTDIYTVRPPRGEYIRKGSAWHHINIRGEKAMTLPGQWRVRTYMDDRLVSSRSFTLADPGLPVSTTSILAIIDADIPVTNMSRPNAVAVVIGNSNYTHNDIPVVRFAHRDAEAMKSYLTKTLGFNERNIIFVTDITKANFESIFGIRGNHRGRLADYVRPGQSEVFIYYSGHGAPDPNDRKGYFLPVDSDPSRIALNGYSLDLFYENIGKIEAKSVTVVLEACFSGGTSTGEMIIGSASPVMIQVKKPDAGGANTTVLASSGYDQISSWYDEKHHGLFTYFFLKALSGDGDLNGDGHITLAEIHEYVSNRTDGVPYWARRLHGRDQGPVLFGSMPDQILVSFD